MCIYRKKQVNYIEWAHIVMEAGRSKICRVGGQARDQVLMCNPVERQSVVKPGRIDFADESSHLENSLSWGKLVLLFCLGFA